MEQFEVTIWAGKYFTFSVEETYNTLQVRRFTVTWSGYEMKLEKRLLVKRRPWKVVSTNFGFTKPDAALNLDNLFRAIDDKIKVDSGYKWVHPKNL